jgi:signal transduction histidine kinase
MRGLTVDLVRPLARKTSMAATLAAVVLTLGTPVTLYLQTRSARAEQAASHAHQMAHLVRTVVIERPDLWYYDTPKLAGYLSLMVEDTEIRQVVVIDQGGRWVNVPEDDEAGWLPRWWAWAPVYRGETVAAQVWVAVDATGGISRVLVMTVLAWALASLLATALYALPIRVVSQAEDHISSLLDKLEGARVELANLNQDLERRVEDRSRQLAQSAEALRLSEARLREVAGRAVEATEQERQRVARELHDSTGQMLTAIRLSLQVADTLLEEGSPARPSLDDLEQLVDDTIDEVRRIAVDLHPAALDRLGLVEGLSELSSGMGSRAGVEIAFETSDVPPNLPAGVQSSCFRLIQEALTNAVRYAEAKLIMVELAFENSTLKISVIDDGQGFDPNEVRRGFGLGGMQDRVAMLGGSLSIESAPGRGTEISIVIPVGTTSADVEPRKEREP